MVQNKAVCVKFAKTCLAAALAFGTAAAKAAVALALALSAAMPAHAAVDWTGANSNLFSDTGNYKTYTYNFVFNNASAKRTLVYLDKNYSGKIKFNNDAEKYRQLVFRAHPDDSPWHFCGWYDNATHSYDNSGDATNGKILIGDSDASCNLRLSAITLKTQTCQIGASGYSYAGHVVMDEYDADGTTYRAPVAFTTTSTMGLYNGDLHATNAVLTCGGDMNLYKFNATISGGSLSVTGKLYIGKNSDNSAMLTVDGGTVTLAADPYIGNSGAGTLTINGGAVEVLGDKWTRVGNASGVAGTINLNGGTLTLNHLRRGNASSNGTLVFNGGTLIANSSYASNGGLICDNLPVTVNEHGGTIDTARNTVTIAASFSGAGAMTFKGGGSITLSGALSYTGGTTNTAGTVLKVNSTAKTALVAHDVTVAIPAGGVADGTVVLETTDGTTFSQEEVDAMAFSGNDDNRYTLELADGGAKVKIVDVRAGEYVWNGGASGDSWKTAGAWTKNGTAGDWHDQVEAVFATAGDAADVDSAVAAASLTFRADATVTGTATLAASSVVVSNGVSATISAPTAGALEKTGPGTLTLGSSRTAATTLSDGTLALAGSNQTTAWGNLAFSTENAVTLRVANGAKLSHSNNAALYLGNTAGQNVTLSLDAGGTVEVRNLFHGAGTGTVVFNGGTLKANTDYSKFGGLIDSDLTVTVTERGGTIDNGGYDITVSKDLAGAMAFTGSGTTTIATNQSATGSMTVSGGTLALASGVTLSRDLTVASGATLSIGSLSADTAAVTGQAISFAAGSTIKLPAITAKGKYKLFALSSGTFAADAADGLPVTGVAVPYTLTVEGDTIYLNIAHDYAFVANIVKTSPTLTGDDEITGAGGFDLSTLSIPANGRVTYDPIKTPIYVWGSSAGALTFGAGAKLALTPNYAGMTLGRVNLIAFKPENVAGLPENLNDLFDETTIAPGATYNVTLEDVPDSTPYRKYLVLTVGDYDSDAKEIRITSIGDSITQGSGDGKKIDGVDQSGYYAQYRTRIAARLAANGYRPRMLGILNNCNREATNCPQSDEWSSHSGLSADRIMTGDDRGGVRDNLHVYLDAAGNVDALTLLIGTNDIGGGKSGEETYTAYTNLVFDIARLRPQTKIIGSTILDRSGGEGVPGHDRVVQFNALLRADYAAGRLPANYTMIDLFEAVPLTTGVEGNFFDDLLHPHWVGCSTIAENFAGAIMSALPFASYAGTIETEATDEPESALGAARIAATLEGATLAAYTNGMSHIFTIETASANNTLGGAAPYTEIVTPAGLDRPVKKAGYFMELVRKGTSHHRWVWVDFDATGKTLDEIDFPWNGANMDFELSKLHVFSNDGSIHNVAADDDTVTGAIEGTCMNYAGTDKEGRPADVEANYAGWNDTLGSSGGYGCFQVHRFFDEGEHWHGGEVLFAWNAWGTSQTAATDQVGIGTFFYSRNINNGKTNYSTDYTGTSDALNGAADTITAAGYQAIRLEIWAELEGEPRHGYWSGASGDFDDPKNWEDGTVPLAGENLDFSLLSAGATVSVSGASKGQKFGTATMGSQVVTFTGEIAFDSLADTTKIAVGANSTVTLDGDLVPASSVVYSVASGGKFVVRGTLTLHSWSDPQVSPGDGTIVVGGLTSVPNAVMLTASNQSYNQKWAIGPGGISGGEGAYMWTYSNPATSSEFRPWTNDVTVSVGSIIRSDAKSLTLNTAGLDGAAHTITLDAGFADNGDPLNVTGTGKVVVNHVTAAIGDRAAYSGAVVVTNSATLAINAGKKLTSGAMTVNSAAALEVAESGEVELGGNLTLKDGATLKFNFTDRRTAPVLNLEGKEVTFGDEKKITVSLNGTVRPAYCADGKWKLTDGFNFAEAGAVVAKAADCADWVKGFGFTDDGDLYADVKATGLMILFR